MTFFRTPPILQHTTTRLAAGLALLAALLMAAAPAQAQDNPDFFLAANDVTVLCPNANVGDTGDVNGTTYTKRDRAGLDALFDADENNPDLATTCTSGIEDMSRLFSYKHSFNQGISSWDVSSVTDMSLMFRRAETFNQDIGGWDVSSVADMSGMFEEAGDFNQDLSGWDVSGAETTGMFREAIALDSVHTPGGLELPVMKTRVFASLFSESLGEASLGEVRAEVPGPGLPRDAQAAGGMYTHPEADDSILLLLVYGSDAEKMIMTVTSQMMGAPPDAVSTEQVQGRTVTLVPERSSAFSLVDQFAVFIGSRGDIDTALLRTLLADYDLDALASWEAPESYTAHSLSDDVCLSKGCFAERVAACDSGQIMAQLGRGRMGPSDVGGIYTVKEPTTDGQCLLSFAFTANPNPDFVGKKVFFPVDPEADVAGNFQEVVAPPMQACLEGSEEASEHCGGPLLETMGTGDGGH